jgi:hypothetical protein
MSGFFGTFLEEIEARTAIEDCLKRFARAVDRQDWALARTLYHEGAFATSTASRSATANGV